MTAKKNTKDTNVSFIEAMLDQEDEQYIRITALSTAVKLFSDTPFKNLLGSAVPLPVVSPVQDVAFYSMVEQFVSFIKTGKFPGYEAFKVAQKKAA